MLVRKIHAIRILLPGDGFRKVLDLEVGLQQFDVEHFTFGGIPAVSPNEVEGQVAIMGLDETVH